MYTIWKKYGRLDGVRVVLLGDVKHSRVIRSNIWGLKTMGASVALCGPATLIPHDVNQFECDVYTNLDEALNGADVVNIMRIQLERQQAGLFPSLREYTNLFGINRDRLKRLNKGYTIMHPGPINRGVEVSSDVADGDASVILDQVTNGQAVRMAVLYLLSGRKEEGGN
jgi:aspartate carbamoyltransferase catalytic subunit